MSSVEAVLSRKILFQFKRKEFYIPSEKVAWRAGSFGAHVFLVEACSGASETRGNEWAHPTIASTGLTSKLLRTGINAFPTYAASS